MKSIFELFSIRIFELYGDLYYREGHVQSCVVCKIELSRFVVFENDSVS